MNEISNKHFFNAKFREVLNERNKPTQLFTGELTAWTNKGAFILTPNELPEGTLIDLDININEGKVVKTEGVVLWKASKRMPGKNVLGMGVEIYFKKLKDLEVIKKLVSAEKESFSLKKWIISNLSVLITLGLIGFIILLLLIKRWSLGV